MMVMAESEEKRIGSHYMIRKAGETYFACDGIDFMWSAQEADMAVELWNEGKDLWSIKKTLRRPLPDVEMLIYSLAREGKLKKRKRGAWGD